MTAQSAVVRRTERWFVRQGLPCLIEGYGFTQHVLPRMLPFLALTVVAGLAWLLPVPSDRMALTVVVGVAGGLCIAAGMALTVFGSRLPRFSRPAATAILLGYALVPLAVPPLVQLTQERPLYLLGTRSAATAVQVAVAIATFVAAFAAIFVASWLVTTYGLVPLTRRAVGHAVADMRGSFDLLGRALPILLFVTLFLFFTGELWQLMNRLAWPRLVLVLALFAAVTVLATGARLRDEIGRVEQDLSTPRLVAAIAGTPLQCTSVDSGPAPSTPLRRQQVLNLLLVLATRQLVQAAVVGVGLFGFFVLLGIIVVDRGTAEQWIGAPPNASVWVPWLPAALPRSAALLAGFGSMYFAITSMTDTERRREFFAPIVDDVERILAARSVYLIARLAPDSGPATPESAISHSGRPAG